MILEHTSGNSSGTTTRGTGVTDQVPIHGAILREVLQCSRGLHPIKSLSGLAVHPQSHHHSLIQKKTKHSNLKEMNHTNETLLRETLKSYTKDARYFQFNCSKM